MGYYTDVVLSTSKEGVYILNKHIIEYLKASEEMKEVFSKHFVVTKDNFNMYNAILNPDSITTSDEVGYVILKWNCIKYYDNFIDNKAFNYALSKLEEYNIPYNMAGIGEDNASWDETNESFDTSPIDIACIAVVCDFEYYDGQGGDIENRTTTIRSDEEIKKTLDEIISLSFKKKKIKVVI